MASPEPELELAWQRHIGSLESTRAWLSTLGANSEICEDGALLTLRLDGGQRESHAAILDRRTAVLPGDGVLSGITLTRREDRLLTFDSSVRSGTDLEIAITTRLEELQRLDRRISEELRRTALETSSGAENAVRSNRRVRLLLAGPTISREQACIESLRMRG